MSWLLSHVFLLLGFMLALPVIAQVVQRRSSPAASLAWLLAIVFLPYLGIPLYLTFGGRKMRRITEDKAPLSLTELQRIRAEASNPVDLLLRSYGIPGACSGHRMHLCLTGEKGYASLVELIEQARQSIWISTFILHPDPVGRSIIELLARRAASGIDVRLLLDGVGSLHTRNRDLKALLTAGGKVAFFMPVLHHPLRGRTNWRNHRKSIIVDRERVWAGGANIATEYIGPTLEAGRWRDLSFILEGPAVQQYLDIFSADWEFATKQKLPIATGKQPEYPPNIGTATVQVVPSGPDVSDDPLYAAIVSAVFGASRRLWVVTPYFIPDETLAQALRLAAHRGVEVNLLIPEISNHRLADLARAPYLRDLQDAGGEIYLYRGGMVHGKALLVDESLALVGSANFDMRSLFLNYETGLFLYDSGEIEQLHTWVTELARSCRRGVPDVGLLRSLGEGVAQLLAPIL